MNEDFISVLMSVHNGEEYLGFAIKSILAQSYRNFEFIIVDDGSQDASRAIILEYQQKDSRIRLVTHKTPQGLLHSLDESLALARGKYIARMDQDDISLPSRFEQQLLLFEKNPALDIVGTSFAEIDSESCILRCVKLPSEDCVIKKRLQCENIFATSSIMARTSVYRLVGGHNAWWGDTVGEYELYLRLKKKYHFGAVHDILHLWRIHKDSTSHKRRREQHKKTFFLHLRELKESSISFEKIRAALMSLCRLLVSAAVRVKIKKYLLNVNLQGCALNEINDADVQNLLQKIKIM